MFPREREFDASGTSGCYSQMDNLAPCVGGGGGLIWGKGSPKKKLFYKQRVFIMGKRKGCFFFLNEDLSNLKRAI